MNYVLLAMEHQITKTNCVFRLMQMLSENSAVSAWIHKLLKEKREAGIVPAEDVIRAALTDELNEGKMPSEEMLTYLMLSVYSKIFCYGMLINDEKYRQEERRKKVRELVNQSICREVTELFELSC